MFVQDCDDGSDWKKNINIFYLKHSNVNVAILKSDNYLNNANFNIFFLFTIVFLTMGLIKSNYVLNPMLKNFLRP